MKPSKFYSFTLCFLAMMPAGAAQAYLDFPVYGQNNTPIYVTPVLTQEQKNEQRKLQLQMLYGIQKYNSCSRSCTDSGAPFLAAMCLGQIEGCLQISTKPSNSYQPSGPSYPAQNCPSGYVQYNGSCITLNEACRNRLGSSYAWIGKIENGQLSCTQPPPQVMYDPVCQKDYGAHSIWVGTSATDGKISCGCAAGHNWNASRTACVTTSAASQPQSTPEEALEARAAAEVALNAEGSAPLLTETGAHLTTDGQAFGVALNAVDAYRLGRFIEDGSDVATRALGSGERRALIRDAFDTVGGAPTSVDTERLASGQIPLTRNLAREQEQLPQARAAFRLIYGRDPNFQSAEENLAWNTLMYRIRFPRDLTREQRGITEYRRLFSQTPSTPFHWATVRLLGYVH